MPHINKILAIGSPFGDDRLGWEIAKQLADRIPDSVQILTLDRPGLTLLTHLENTIAALIIDAIHSGASPGTIYWLTGDDIPNTHQPTSSHNIGITETYQLGKTLGLLPQNLHLCGIEMDTEWQSQDALSPAAMQAIPQLIEEIQAFFAIST